MLTLTNQTSNIPTKGDITKCVRVYVAIAMLPHARPGAYKQQEHVLQDGGGEAHNHTLGQQGERSRRRKRRHTHTH